MKAKDGMTKLRRKMVITFLVITFIASIFDTVIDEIMNRLEPYMDKHLDSTLLIASGMLILNISVYVISAVIFYKLTAKYLKAESERRLKEQNLIYGAVAHDFKTPMTSVQGFAKALSDGKIRPEEQQEIFDLICRKSNSMNDMVNTLFEYSKLGTDGYIPNFTETDICALMREIIAENYCDFEDHGIGLDIDIPDEAVIINADKNELKRAITNLIVNIYKHNPDGIKAKISVSEVSGKAVIRIADSGNALPEGVDIFEPFVTENTARTVGQGTGLGLAVTKRVIECHGGDITVGSAVSDYTKEFVITI